MNTTAKITNYPPNQNFFNVKDELDSNKVLYCLDNEGVLRYEEFRDVPKWEGFYQISSFGRVKSLEREVSNGVGYRIVRESTLRITINRGGYVTCGLHNSKHELRASIHQLVAEAFLNHKPNGMASQVDHIDEMKTNNFVWNLQILTSREHSHKTRGKMDSSSDYIGVRILKKTGVIVSQINHKGEDIYLGKFDTEKEASLYYQNALKAIENGTEIKVKKHKWSSKYKGVSWNRINERWRAYIPMNGKRKDLGYFETEEEAHLTRQKALGDSKYN